MGDPGMGAARGGPGGDVVLPREARDLPVVGAQDLAAHDACGGGSAAGGVGCTGDRDAAAGDGGGEGGEGGVDALVHEENARRGRILRIETAERLQLVRPPAQGGAGGGGGWRNRAPQPSPELKAQIDALAGTIRTLTREKGRDHADTRAAITRMNELRAAIPKRSGAAGGKKKASADGRPPEQPAKKLRPSDPLSAKRQPVTIVCETPLYLRNTVRPIADALLLRSSCGHPATLTLLNELIAYRGTRVTCLQAVLVEVRGLAATCDVCAWNLATHYVTRGELEGAEAVLQQYVRVEGAGDIACTASPAVAPRLILLRGMVDEVRSITAPAAGGGDGAALRDRCGALYRAAIRADVKRGSLAASTSTVLGEYFGMLLVDRPGLGAGAVHAASASTSPSAPPVDGKDKEEGGIASESLLLFTDLRIGDRMSTVPVALAGGGGAVGPVTAHAMQHSAVLDLLRAIEFGKAPLSAHPPVCPTAQFTDELHCCVRHFLPTDLTRLLSQHYKQMIASGVVNFGDRRTERYFLYNDPVARLVMAQYTPFISKLYGAPVKPSYSYMISYRDESELLPHQDREQAEIVVTIQLDSFPDCDQWPLYIGAVPQAPRRGDAPKPAPEHHRMHVLYDGDAVVFRGRRMIHWREKITPGTETSMLLIHYVDAGYRGSLKQGFKE